MSIVSTQHDIVDFISGTSKALSDQRLSVISFKTEGMKSKCVSIPQLQLSDDDWELLKPVAMSYFETVQDKIIRSAILNGATSIADGVIDAASIAEWFESESESGRLTKDALNAWFAASLANKLTAAFLDKLAITSLAEATAQQHKAITASVDSYKDKLTALASGRTMFSADVITLLQKALSYCTAEDGIAKRLQAKLVKMAQKQQAEEAIALLTL
jgi:hypothetical protein